MCNCPTPDELFRSIDDRIDERRWLLPAVNFAPDAVGASRWVYSIGLTEGYGHPELCLVGAWCASCSAKVLDELGDRIAAGERFDVATDDAVWLPRIRWFVHLRPVTGAPLETSWFALWHRYYDAKPYAGPTLSVMQVVVPDRRGRFPWEPGCDPAVAALQQVPDEPDETRPNRAARRRAARHRR